MFPTARQARGSCSVRKAIYALDLAQTGNVATTEAKLDEYVLRQRWTMTTITLRQTIQRPLTRSSPGCRYPLSLYAVPGPSLTGVSLRTPGACAKPYQMTTNPSPE